MFGWGTTGRVHWAWTGTIAIGAVLVLWILLEFLIITDISWLQPTLLGVARS